MQNQDAVIFDIDGTMANLEHRLGYIKDGHKDWDAFFDHMDQDEPIDDVVWFFDAWTELVRDCHVFICTGRPETHRAMTEAWLSRNTNWWDEKHVLLMRSAGDHRSDVEVKKEMLEGIRGQGYNIRFAVDDRQRVVDMWRANGVTCLQAAPSDWDTGKGKFKPGVLTLMVGPSGSGKSTIIQKANAGHQTISSDGLRAEICGSFEDQSKNAQVFTALHALVETRINMGLDTIVDATNIRNADRKKIRDLVPEDTKIFYVVVDRPLAEKHETGGWRDTVIIKDQKLIDYHHNTFQSNKKAIMNGDGDPRVSVVNMIQKG